jgi:ABC-2 type transport system ATP-binding protein
MTAEAARRRAATLLEITALADAVDRPAAKLSGGMRRKLGFAAVMMHEPQLLVLDEPSTGVDPVARVDLWALISAAAAGGTAVLFSTTYLDEAERAARMVVLDAGRVVLTGSSADALAELPGCLTAGPRPQRPDWAWRRGRSFHEYWPDGTSPPPGSTVLSPDLEDVVIARSLLGRAGGAR